MLSKILRKQVAKIVKQLDKPECCTWCNGTGLVRSEQEFPNGIMYECVGCYRATFTRAAPSLVTVLTVLKKVLKADKQGDLKL